LGRRMSIPRQPEPHCGAVIGVPQIWQSLDANAETRSQAAPKLPTPLNPTPYEKSNQDNQSCSAIMP